MNIVSWMPSQHKNTISTIINDIIAQFSENFTMKMVKQDKVKYQSDTNDWNVFFYK